MHRCLCLQTILALKISPIESFIGHRGHSCGPGRDEILPNIGKFFNWNCILTVAWHRSSVILICAMCPLAATSSPNSQPGLHSSYEFLKVFAPSLKLQVPQALRAWKLKKRYQTEWPWKVAKILRTLTDHFNLAYPKFTRIFLLLQPMLQNWATTTTERKSYNNKKKSKKSTKSKIY